MMNYEKISHLILYLIIISCSLISCSSSKNLTDSASSQNLNEIKELLTFKTYFGADGSMDIKATNNGDKALDITYLSVIINQVNGNQSRAYSLEDLGINREIQSLEMAIFDLSLEERITEDFNGVADKYNVILAYNSKKPIENSDERSVYFITYKYPHR